MLKVWGSMSQITGISPHWITGHTVVDHERAGTITSSPGFSPSLVAGLASAATARRLADEPELFITPSVQPKVEVKTSSNFFTFGPMVTKVESKHSSAALISPALKVGSCRRTTGFFGSKA